MSRIALFSAACLFSHLAWPVGFDLGPLSGSVTSDFTIGATWRVEDRDPSLIAKINLAPGLCTRTNRTTDPDAQTLSYPGAQPGDIGSTCNSTSDPSLNLAYVRAPGSYNINGDNGNLNFDQGDVVASAAKLNSKFNLYWGNFTLEGRGIWFFDETYVGFDETHPDTSLQRASTPLSAGAEDQFGTDFELVELFVSTFVPIGSRTLSLRLGRHSLNWGESTALPLNSINTINPPDLRRTRIPGFDLEELFTPVGLFSAQMDLSLNLSAEVFYQFEWLPAIIDAPGTFFSTSDVFGGENPEDYYALLSFGKSPEDPAGLYSSEDNPDDPFTLASASGRTIYRLPDQEPEDGGQYGIALRYFAENFNNGTEFAFYYTKYHSRIPSASFFAADETCAVDATNLVGILAACGALVGDIGTLRLIEEPLPVDTVRLFAEYPEDIHLFGVSFNTTIGGWAFSGEYAYRPNMPLQIQTTDLTFAALQPAFPRNNINVGVPAGLPLPDLGPIPATVLPGRRVAVPDYVETLFRGNEVQPGQYIRGYERVKLGQLTSTLIKTFGADNPLRASQIAVIAEFGLTHVIDLPSLNQLQFQGAETNTHASAGADGTRNGLTDSATIESDGDGDARCERQSFASIGGAEAEPCRQNPTAQDPEAFGDDLAYGLRMLGVLRYQDFLFGSNLDVTLGVFYDIDGVAPGVGQNFQEDTLQALIGFRVEYLSRYSAEVRYVHFGGERNPRADRDTVGLALRYSF